MKIAFSTVAEPNATYEEIITAAKKAGIPFAEVRLDGKNHFFGLEGPDLEKALLDFQSAGIQISDLGASITVTKYNPDQLETVRNVASLTKRVGAKGFRVFPAAFFKKYSEKPLTDSDGITAQMKEIAKIAQEAGVEAWIETHNAYSTGAALLPLLKEVNSPNLKVIWDLMHSFEVGESPAETVKLIGPFISHVHIKDGIPKEDPDLATFLYTKLGEGIVPVQESLSELAKIGYSGCLSLEWEKAWRAELADTYSCLDDTLSAFINYMNHITQGITTIE